MNDFKLIGDFEMDIVLPPPCCAHEKIIIQKWPGIKQELQVFIAYQLPPYIETVASIVMLFTTATYAKQIVFSPERISLNLSFDPNRIYTHTDIKKVAIQGTHAPEEVVEEMNQEMAQLRFKLDLDWRLRYHLRHFLLFLLEPVYQNCNACIKG